MQIALGMRLLIYILTHKYFILLQIAITIFTMLNHLERIRFQIEHVLNDIHGNEMTGGHMGEKRTQANIA